MTVAALAKEWMAENRMRNLAASTLRAYERDVGDYVIPRMGNWLIREATTGKVDRGLKDHVAAGFKAKHLKSVSSQMFALAVRHDAIPTSPVTNVARL